MHEDLLVGVVAITWCADRCEVRIQKALIDSRHRPCAGELKQDMIARLEGVNICLEADCQASKCVNSCETKQWCARAERVVSGDGMEHKWLQSVCHVHEVVAVFVDRSRNTLNCEPKSNIRINTVQKLKEKRYSTHFFNILHADAVAVIVVSARSVTYSSCLIALGLKISGMWIS